MKILIIGEYSGFAKYLSRGFHQLGHESFVFSWGDKFKKISQDNQSYNVIETGYSIRKHYIKGTGWIRRIISAFQLNMFMKKMPHDWDCAFIVNFGFVKESKYDVFKPYPTIHQIIRCLKDKNEIYLSACGGDYIFYEYYKLRKLRKISEYEIEKANKLANGECKEKFLLLMKYVKSIIPIAVEYDKAYRYFQSQFDYRLSNAIPLPFDVSNKKNSIHNANGKIVIMHGVNRYYEKGSNIIIPAMKKLKEKYHDLVEINIVTHVPLVQFLKYLDEADIVIDNCYGDSNSMTAVEALSMGKVVLAGNEPGHTKRFGIAMDSPVIDIWPDVDSIYCELEKLVLNPDIIRSLSKQSREYACQVHDCKKVAAKYINVFKES